MHLVGSGVTVVNSFLKNILSIRLEDYYSIANKLDSCDINSPFYRVEFNSKDGVERYKTLTPISYAITSNNEEMVDYLLENGAKLQIKEEFKNFSYKIFKQRLPAHKGRKCTDIKIDEKDTERVKEKFPESINDSKLENYMRAYIKEVLNKRGERKYSHSNEYSYSSESIETESSSYSRQLFLIILCQNKKVFFYELLECIKLRILKIDIAINSVNKGF